MDVVFAMLIVVILIIGCAIGLYQWLTYRRLKTFEDEVDAYIDEYLTRLTGANRFLLTEDVLAEAFSEYSRQDVREIWKRLVARRRVGRDPLDEAMCIIK